MSNKDVQEKLIKQRLLDPPADGVWGTQSVAALRDFQQSRGLAATGELTGATLSLLNVAPEPTLNLGADLASRIVREMLRCGYWVSAGAQRYNIVYLEGADQNGKPNADGFNEWNDRRIVIEIVECVPRIIGNWLATTEPGSTYTYAPMNSEGAFRIAFGQYKAWKFGLHGRTQYPALVQCGEIAGHRDKNKDGKRTGDPMVRGADFGVNQHHGWDMQFVGPASAGCLVGQSIEGHHDFMNLLKRDRRYCANNRYTFYTTILPGDKLP
jgi:hypothetical protein